MVRRGPLPEDLDVDYLVECELERLRRLQWEAERKKYVDAQRRERDEARRIAANIAKLPWLLQTQRRTLNDII